MSKWKKLKKFIVADLSKNQDSFSLGHWKDKPSRETQDHGTNKMTKSLPQVDTLQEDGVLSPQLALNLDWFMDHFSYPQSQGLVVRRFVLGHSSVQGAVVYLGGQINVELLTRSVLVPLITMDLPDDCSLDADVILEQIVTEAQVSLTKQKGQIVHGVLTGSAAVLVEGLNQAVLVEVQGWEKRAIDKPNTEIVVRGSNEGFTEDLQTNLSLIRRRLRTSDLMIEMGNVGNISRTDIAVVYLKSIANEDLVAEVRKRIADIQFDYIGDSGTIEQFIEDRSNTLYPTVMSTERPDRVAALVTDGYISILVDNSPFALIVPAQFPLFLQTAEDAYLRWEYSTFLRVIRVIGFALSMYLPAIYVAIANFHQEMIPTSLMLAIAGTRESVPIPVAAEAFMLESMFELIREAGVRIPSVIGPTIGIVGALILGQAAVQANIVSPIVVIITSTTALASYSIPNYNMQFSTRILRFIYLLAGSVLGLVGIVLLSIIFWSFRAASNSFGVPILSPITPYRRSSDNIVRQSVSKQKYRPLSIRPKKVRRIPSNQDGTPQKSSEQQEAKK